MAPGEGYKLRFGEDKLNMGGNVVNARPLAMYLNSEEGRLKLV
jgi:hypothetical protein